MHRLIISLVLLALVAAPVPGLAMQALDESGQPAEEQVQSGSEQSAAQGGETAAAATSAPKPAVRAIIKAQPKAKGAPSTIYKPQ